MNLRKDHYHIHAPLHLPKLDKSNFVIFLRHANFLLRRSAGPRRGDPDVCYTHCTHSFPALRAWNDHLGPIILGVIRKTHTTPYTLMLEAPVSNIKTKPTLSATDVLAPTTMKNAAKCDTSCELQNPVSHQIFERNLHFLGSMSVGVSVHPH